MRGRWVAFGALSLVLAACASGAGVEGQAGPSAGGGDASSSRASSSTASTHHGPASSGAGANGGGGGEAGGGGEGGQGHGGGGAGPLPYPTRTAYRIKSLQPDFWPDKDEIAGNNTGGVSMNLVWAFWEANVKAPPCDPASEEEYDGHCFVVDANVDASITDWSARGVVVTAITYGVPAWDRVANCSPVSAGFEIFCAPENAADYARFAGMLARRYDGMHGHGRIADFVIHNEVNSNDWFDVGCGQGTPCDANAWIGKYAESYDAAYDAVMANQPNDKVLISLEHHWSSSLDAPAAPSPLLGGETFLTRLGPLLAPRAWRVAFHPYAPDLRSPTFGADDLPNVTYGNIGVLSGWLRKTYPNVPSTAEIQLTESGINSLAPSSTNAAQADAVCRSFQNVLGTPGIENYVYHRMVDNPVETASGLGLGLRNADSSAKPAWATWALANRNDTNPPMLSCGFENLPYTILTRSNLTGRGHWASSRIAPSGFVAERSWRLLRDPQPGTVLLYECAVGKHNLLTQDVNCENQQPMGPVGYAFTAPQAGSIPIHRCSIGGGADHFISPDPACEGKTFETTLGYSAP